MSPGRALGLTSVSCRQSTVLPRGCSCPGRPPTEGGRCWEAVSGLFPARCATQCHGLGMSGARGTRGQRHHLTPPPWTQLCEASGMLPPSFPFCKTGVSVSSPLEEQLRGAGGRSGGKGLRWSGWWGGHPGGSLRWQLGREKAWRRACGNIRPRVGPEAVGGDGIPQNL